MKLSGKTLKGKNRIREHGNEWLLIKTSEKVLFAQRSGPWGLVYPTKSGLDHSRWIHLHDDDDFEITKL